MLAFLLSIADESNQFKLEHIYNLYHDDMIRFARYRLKKAGCINYEIDSEDVVQNSFVKIIKYIDAIDFNTSPKELKSYIFSIVANEANTIVSDYVFWENLDDYSDIISDDFLEEIEIELRYDEIVDDIKKMDERYSIPLYFYCCQDMSVKDISKLMGIPEKSVYTRLARGKKFLLEISNYVKGELII